MNVKHVLFLLLTLTPVLGFSNENSFAFSCKLKKPTLTWSLTWDSIVVDKKTVFVDYKLQNTSTGTDTESFNSKTKKGDWKEEDFSITSDPSQQSLILVVPEAKGEVLQNPTDSVKRSSISISFPYSLLQSQLIHNQNFEAEITESLHTALPVGTELTCDYQTRVVSIGGAQGTPEYDSTKKFTEKLNLLKEELDKDSFSGYDLTVSYLKKLELRDTGTHPFSITCLSLSSGPHPVAGAEALPALETCRLEMSVSLSKFEWADNGTDELSEKLTFSYNLSSRDSIAVHKAFKPLFTDLSNPHDSNSLIKELKIPVKQSLDSSIEGGTITIRCSDQSHCSISSDAIDFSVVAL